jgi:Asp-tRNA(Asn)/Glu-tRNA(Gln) amidotransferase A subunit family amidase
VAFPAGLDARGLPVGIELIGRPQADEALTDETVKSALAGR